MHSQRHCNTVEAKAKLNELLDEVVKGHEVFIKRRGRTVAKLIGASEEALDDRPQTKQLMQRLRLFHERLRNHHGTKNHTISLLRELRRQS